MGEGDREGDRDQERERGERERERERTRLRGSGGGGGDLELCRSSRAGDEPRSRSSLDLRRCTTLGGDRDRNAATLPSEGGAPRITRRRGELGLRFLEPGLGLARGGGLRLLRKRTALAAS